MSKTYVWIPTSETAMAPSLVILVKKSDKKGKFIIALQHPNTKEIVFAKSVKAKDFEEAMSIGKRIKSKYKHIKTEYVEHKFIPSPPRGKKKLNKE